MAHIYHHEHKTVTNPLLGLEMGVSAFRHDPGDRGVSGWIGFDLSCNLYRWTLLVSDPIRNIGPAEAADIILMIELIERLCRSMNLYLQNRGLADPEINPLPV